MRIPIRNKNRGLNNDRKAHCGAEWKRKEGLFSNGSGGEFILFSNWRWTVITFHLISLSPLTLRSHQGNVCGFFCLGENGFVQH